MNNNPLFYRHVGNILSSYVSNRDKAIQKYREEIAEINLQIEKENAFTKSINNLNREILEERQRAMKYCMDALDMAIEKGDTEIASIAMSMIRDEYSNDILKYNLY